MALFRRPSMPVKTGTNWIRTFAGVISLTIALLFLALHGASFAKDQATLDQLKDLISKQNKKLETITAYEVELTHHAKDGIRNDRYIFKNGLWYHEYTTQDKNFKEVVDLNNTQTIEYSSRGIRRSGLRKVNYHRIALGHIPHKENLSPLENQVVDDKNEAQVVLQFRNGSKKYFRFDKSSLIVTERQDFDQNGKLSHRITRKLVTFSPHHDSDFFKQYITRFKEIEDKKKDKKKRQSVSDHVAGIIGIFFIPLLFGVLLIKKFQIQPMRLKILVVVTLLGTSYGFTVLMILATRGFLSMLLAGIAWNLLKPISQGAYETFGPYLTGLLVSVATTLPACMGFWFYFRCRRDKST